MYNAVHPRLPVCNPSPAEYIDQPSNNQDATYSDVSTTSAVPWACHQTVPLGDHSANSASTCSAAMVAYVVVDNVDPVPRGARRPSIRRPRVVKSAE